MTGLTRVAEVTRSLDAVVRRLRGANPTVAIVVTGAPDMGAIPRLAQPLRALAGWRTDRVNSGIGDLVQRRGLVLAPIAARTGPAFRSDRGLFARDRFHPDARGYATWVPVLNAALDAALRRARPAA